MGPETRPRVAIIQSRVRQYRKAFFEELRRVLADENIDLDLYFCNPPGQSDSRRDTFDLPWAQQVRETEIRVGDYSLTWQWCLKRVYGADVVVVEQASRHMLNYVLIAAQALGGPRVAYWGHGRNFKELTPTKRISEFVKRAVSRQGQWFFAYNDLSAGVVTQQLGYPPDRVTALGNSVDTISLAAARDGVTPDEIASLRSKLGITGNHVGIYCGAMYEEKRLPFLVEAAVEIRKIVADFELICVGSGEQSFLIEEAASKHGWIHAVGPQFGEGLARHFALARVFLLPGVVGLAVLDSFVFEVPLVTTLDAPHNPEVSYLEAGKNGIMAGVEGDIDQYVAAAVQVLTDEGLSKKLKEGCRRSARLYSVEAMALRFAEGIQLLLDSKRQGIARLAS